MSSKRMTFGQATLDAMEFAMLEDQNIIAIGEDISWGGNFGQFRGLVEKFGSSRIIDMPISEALIVSAALGAAVSGLKVVASMSFVEFTLGAMDEIVNQASKFRYMFGGQVSVPIVIRASDGIRGSSGPQHSSSLESLFCHIPGLKVLAPSNANDAKGLLRAAIRDPDPVIYLEHKRITGVRSEVEDGDFSTPLGVARIARHGSSVSVITYSDMVNKALSAAEEMKKYGVDVEVIDLRSLVPLDYACIEESALRTRNVVVAHESWKFCGFGSEIVAHLAEKFGGDLNIRLARVGAKSAPIPFSPILESQVVPGEEEIVQSISKILGINLGAFREF